MCLRVDPLKDAAGSSFGKADRLCLYLHDQKLPSGGAPTPAGTSVFTKHNWDMEWGICGLMGGAFIT